MTTPDVTMTTRDVTMTTHEHEVTMSTIQVPLDRILEEVNQSGSRPDPFDQEEVMEATMVLDM